MEMQLPKLHRLIPYSPISWTFISFLLLLLVLWAHGEMKNGEELLSLPCHLGSK